MKLAFRFALTVICAILGVLALNAIIDVQREIALFDADTRMDNHALGRAIAAAASTSWKLGGESEARSVIANASEGDEVIVRFVWLDAVDGEPDAPETPQALLRPVVGKDPEIFVRWRRPSDQAESLYTYVPLSLPGSRPAAIELRESLADEASYVRQTALQAALAIGTLVLICGTLVIALGVLLIGRPVHQLVEHARRIGTGDLTHRLHLSRKDEIGELSAEMNAMCERLERAARRLDAESRERVATLDQLRHADRLTTVGRLASGLAHELGTPLNIITGHAQLITDDYDPRSAAHENAGVIAQQAQRVAAIIRQLLDFARRRTPRRASHEVLELVRQAVLLLAPLAQKHRIELDVEPAAESYRGLVDPEQLKQAIMNLALNAIQAMPAGGRLRVRMNRSTLKPPPEHGGAEADYLGIEFIDSGIGIPADVLPRVFEPFVTTKDPGEGTGLGLSVAYGIVVEHGGWIEVESTVGQGSRFCVHLPEEELS